MDGMTPSVVPMITAKEARAMLREVIRSMRRKKASMPLCKHLKPSNNRLRDHRS